MIPPLIRFCPNCGHFGRASKFRAVRHEDGRRVECPVCQHRFVPIDNPLLN